MMHGTLGFLGQILWSYLRNGMLTRQWKGSVIVTVYKKSDTTDCSNYRRISLLITPIHTVSNILLSVLNLHVEKIMADNLCGLQRSKSNLCSVFFKYLENKKGG